MKKEKVFIDEYHTEDGYTIYRLMSEENYTASKTGSFISKNYEPAKCTSNGGFFFYRDGVDDFIAEHADEIEVVKDFRSEPC